jgi:hypothetical protein
MASFSARWNSHQAPPGGSVLSRALIRGAISLQLEAQPLPQPYPLLSKNALDGASAAYRLRVQPLALFASRLNPF